MAKTTGLEITITEITARQLKISKVHLLQLETGEAKATFTELLPQAIKTGGERGVAGVIHPATLPEKAQSTDCRAVSCCCRLACNCFSAKANKRNTPRSNTW